MLTILDIDKMEADDRYKYSYQLYSNQVKLISIKLIWRNQYETHKQI